MHEAKTHLSQLIAAAQRGQEELNCKNGKPVARIEPALAAGPVAQDQRRPARRPAPQSPRRRAPAFNRPWVRSASHNRLLSAGA